MGRQPVAIGQSSGGNVLAKRLGNRQIARPGAVSKIGQPICHGDNIIIDAKL
jgi:hypothetical protein